MRCLLIILQILTTLSIHAQTNVITGRVVQESSREPIAGASVFISNSTKGTISKPDGSFTFNGLAANSYQLQISVTSYQSYRSGIINLTDQKQVSL